MSNYQNSEVLQQLTLGKATNYVSEYTPNLLQRVPRSLNRNSLTIKADNLPFTGEDVWYGYELSWLNQQGKPVVAVAQFRFPCQSEFIVESKSFKLYLNSFNQSKFSSFEHVANVLTKDLSQTVGTQAKVSLFPVNDCPALNIQYLSAICIDEIDVTINNYNFDANLLNSNTAKNIMPVAAENINETLVSHLLKSNCLITNQPDWATIYIDYEGEAICHESLLKYLISFRQHNEFHEQCVERIFTDLINHFQLKKLTVFARYTRRGGLDINPFRSTHLTNAPLARTLRQ
jgi:7-cyano-7-deazaguanine reductase